MTDDRKDNPVINKAVHAIVDMSRNTQLRERARIREKALHDEASLLNQAKKEGIDIGISKGRAEGIDIGISKGIDIGVSKGKAEGRAESLIEFAQILRQQGMSEAQVQMCISQMKQ